MFFVDWALGRTLHDLSPWVFESLLYIATTCLWAIVNLLGGAVGPYPMLFSFRNVVPGAGVHITANWPKLRSELFRQISIRLLDLRFRYPKRQKSVHNLF